MTELDQYKAHVAILTEALDQLLDDIASESYLFDGGNGVSATSEEQAKQVLSRTTADSYEELKKLREEIAALKAENENLKRDAELWRGYQKRKQDLLDRGFLRSPLRADELDATAQGEKG